MRLLMLEDDAELLASIVVVLRSRGIAVDETRRLREATERLRTTSYDVAVLDRCLPDGDAAVMVRRLRGAGLSTPVLFLTALDAVHDRVRGLDAGGDDYLVKPFAMEELLARVRSLARRGGVSPTAPTLTLGDLIIDTDRVSVSRGGRALILTPKEFSLLVYLVRNSRRVISRTELLDHCWDEYASPASNVIEVRIRLLRAKLGEPPLLHTVRSAGYVAELRS